MNYNPDLVGSQKDGNIAIKCNYCDGGRNGDHIGFSGVCSDRIINYNIEVEHRVWCNNDSCPCFQYHNRKISRSRLEEIMATPSEFVCYESTMLSDWATQAGLYEDGRTKSFGSTLHTGAVCVFTTRLPDMAEYDRFIFGMFIIDELFHGNSQKSGYVKCNTDYHIELAPEESKRIKFWNYYRNKNNPEKEQWGTGLYRFISNKSIVAILIELINMRSDSKKDEAIRFLTEFCRRNNLKMPEVDYSKDTILEKSDKPIVSFSCGETYDLVMKTNVHAHPLKSGFPSKISRYLMVRATGGVSEDLFEVEDTVDLNPLDRDAVIKLPDKYAMVRKYIKMRASSFGFKNAPLFYRFYLLKRVKKISPAYIINPNPQGFRYLSFDDIGIDKVTVSTPSNVNRNRDNFIESLGLPEGFEVKHFEGMNRFHFKYNGVGFAVIDMKRDSYNLRTREKYLDAVGVADYGITQHHSPNSAFVRDVSYNDTAVIFKLFEYVSGESFEAGSFVKQELELEEQSIEKDIQNSNLIGTDKVAVVKARVNQGVFRDRLIRKYGKCCLCGADEESLLIASHIKPWVDSTPEERVDENNGLLLCPNHDRLFDRGFITFNDDGSIIITEALSDNNRIFLNIDSNASLALNESTKKYMEYHRNNIYIDREIVDTVVTTDEEYNVVSSESSTPTSVPVDIKIEGPFPDYLINAEVEDIRYGVGIIIHVDSHKPELEVKFDHEIGNKTFIYPDCFLSKRLTVKDDTLQIELDKLLQGN